MITKKKGIQLNQAFSAVLVVVLIAVLVIIGIFLFDTLGNTFIDKAVSTTNESVVANQVTNVSLAGAATCNFGDDVTGGDVYNGTAGVLVTSGNYTIAADGNVILVDALFDGDTLLVSYTYTNGGSACTATDEMIVQFGNYPALIGLVGTIVFLGLVIGILVVSFVFGGKKDQP